MAPMTASSTRACAGQHFWLAESRRSPLATRMTGGIHTLWHRPSATVLCIRAACSGSDAVDQCVVNEVAVGHAFLKTKSRNAGPGRRCDHERTHRFVADAQEANIRGWHVFGLGTKLL